MKLGKATIYFYSLESYEEPKEVLQETLNYKDWVSYDLFNYESVDVGEWHDEIDLNNSSLTKQEETYSKYFENKPTTEINIDYYDELKTKADKWDEKETPFVVQEYYSDGRTKQGFCRCTAVVRESEMYCWSCGQRITFESEE